VRKALWFYMVFEDETVRAPGWCGTAPFVATRLAYTTRQSVPQAEPNSSAAFGPQLPAA